MDSGFFALEIQSLSLTLDKKPDNELSVRVDLELQNSHNVFKWAASDTSIFSTAVSKPVLNHSENEDTFNYILGFDELTIKSVLLDLEDQVLTGLSNVNVKIKVLSINTDAAATQAPAKPAKGAPPPPVIPAEEVLFEVFIPLHSAITNKSGVISISQPLEELSSASSQDVHVKVLYPNIVPATSSFGVTLSLDNGLTEYVLGCRILRWEWGSLRNADPTVWGLKSPDAVDPKAKIQPTAADLRTKYIENMKRLISTQDKVAKYHLSVGSQEKDDSSESLFPTLELSHGLIDFDFDLAASVPIEEDIRARADLWTVKWQPSQVMFIHRKVLRSFILHLEEDSAVSTLSVLVKKIPAPEAAAVEGTAETSMRATLNVAGIIQPGSSSVDASAENFNVSGQPLLQLSLNSSTPFVMPSLLQDIAKMKLPKTEPSEPLQVSSNDSNKDALKEIRDEIVSTIERIAQEYLAIYPNATAPPPTGGGDASAAAPTQNKDEKKLEFMTFLTSNGIFHELKENLKPRVHTLMKEKFGVRGRALGRSDAMKSVDLAYTESSIVSSNTVSEETIETALSELYVFLQKECAAILNSLFSDTLIDRDRSELTNSAFINDEEITETQVFKRLKEQALDAAADLRYTAAESLHLERIQISSHSIRLGSREDSIHEAYTDYAVFLLHQFAKMGSITAPKNGVRPSAPLKTLLNRAREALSFAHNAKREDWKVSLLYACMLIEFEQDGEAETAIHETISSQMTKGKYTLTNLQEFDGYDSDSLCPIDPKCYCVLATLFTLQKHPIRARKAILMAQRSFVEGGYQPPVSTHGSPRRTVVLCLADTALYLLEHGFLKLGRACLDLATECEEAVTNKAQARGKAPVTVPHIRHLLKRAQTVALLYPVEPVSDAVLQSNQASNPLMNAVDLAIESELAADNIEDKINAWLAIARVQATLYDSTVVVNSYLNAMKLAGDFPVTELKEQQVNKNVIPLDAFVSVGRLLLTTGRFSECIQAMLFAAAVYSSSTIFLMLGVSFLRLDKLEDAEEALIDANLLDSSNFDVWAYLTLLCLLSGPNRVEEAERSLFQALRLGLTNTALLRELATQFMAIDRMQTAEDLIRRALTQEAADGNRQSLLSRKLLGNVLAAQNQAASAIEEYQKILSTPEGDSGASEEEVKQSKFEAAEKCYDLLSQLGREEEMKIVKNIMKSLSKDLHKQNLAAKGSKHGHHHSGNKSHKVSEQ